MEEEKKTLKEYEKEFGVPIWVIIQALKNGIVDNDGIKHSPMRLEFRNGQWWLVNVLDCFLLSNFGRTWTFYEKKKTYAEVKCDEIHCNKCPLRNLNYCWSQGTLQESLDSIEDMDEDVREFYQNKINKEYKEW